MHEGRKDVVSGKHMVIFEKAQCDENRKQRERGSCGCWQKPVGHTLQLVLYPKYPGCSRSRSPQLLQDLTFLGYIQGVFSAQPHYVTLGTALEAVGPGKWGKSKESFAVGLWGACDHTEMVTVYWGCWNQECAQVGKTMGGGQKRRTLT